MKKIKNIIIVLIVVATVGGALAFKANKTIYELDPDTGRCTIPIYYTITINCTKTKTVTTIYDGPDCTTRCVILDM